MISVGNETIQFGEVVYGNFELLNPIQTSVSDEYVKPYSSQQFRRFSMSAFHFAPQKIEDFYLADRGAVRAHINGDYFISKCLADAKKHYEDSVISNNKQERKKSLMEIGMLLHIFADTWAHEGFSGYYSESNHADVLEVYAGEDSSGILDKIAKYIGALDCGHGCLLEYPDLTYVEYKWKTCKDEKIHKRYNADYFTEVSEEIFTYLVSFNEKHRKVESWRKLSGVLKNAFVKPYEKTGKFSSLKKNWEVFNFFLDMEGEDIFYYDKTTVIPKVFGYEAEDSLVDNDDLVNFIQLIEDYWIKIYGPKPRSNNKKNYGK